MLAAHLATLILAVSSAPAPASPAETVLLDFRADWCGPCRSMDSVVQQLSASGYPVKTVNIDQQHDLAARFHVESIPCFVLLVNGREVDRTVGATGGGTLAGMFRKAGYDPAARLAAVKRGRDAPAPGNEFPAEVSQTPLTKTTFVSTNDSGATSSRTAADVGGGSSTPSTACCVRIKVADPKGNSIGSGTIIDARQGEALVLTCGHIFRDSDGKGIISVDLFGPGLPQHVPGRLIGCDLERDVALVGIGIKVPVPSARVAPPSSAVNKGDRVVGIGCSDGADPTAIASHVDALDRFSGPPNIEVAGQPVQGRSGGGLFNAEGQVIGVCNAADPSDNEGMFAALGSIYKELDRARLPFVYRDSTPASASAAVVASGDLPAMPARMPPAGVAANSPDSNRRLTSADAAALAELGDKAHGAEVICIIHPLSNPDAKSEVIVLDKASQEFLAELAAEQRSQPARKLTSLEVGGQRSTFGDRRPAAGQPERSDR